jgi:hypothetical protein
MSQDLGADGHRDRHGDTADQFEWCERRAAAAHRRARTVTWAVLAAPGGSHVRPSWCRCQRSDVRGRRGGAPQGRSGSRQATAPRRDRVRAGSRTRCRSGRAAPGPERSRRGPGHRSLGFRSRRAALGRSTGTSTTAMARGSGVPVGARHAERRGEFDPPADVRLLALPERQHDQRALGGSPAGRRYSVPSSARPTAGASRTTVSSYPRGESPCPPPPWCCGDPTRGRGA